MCKPLSTFRVDCNTCLCTSNGRQFTCTSKACPPPVSEEKIHFTRFSPASLPKNYENRFIEERNEQGYIILRPITRPTSFPTGSSEEFETKSSSAPVIVRYEKDIRPENRVDSGEEVAEYVISDLEESRSGDEDIEEISDEYKIDWESILPVRIRLS